MARPINRLRSEANTRANYIPEARRDAFVKYATHLLDEIFDPAEMGTLNAIDQLKPEHALAKVTRLIGEARTKLAPPLAANRDVRDAAEEMRSTARKLQPKYPEQHAELRAAFRQLSENERIRLLRHTDNVELVVALQTFAGPQELAPVSADDVAAAAARLGDPQLTANAAELFEVFKHRELLAQATSRALDELAQAAGVPVHREPVRL